MKHWIAITNNFCATLSVVKIYFSWQYKQQHNEYVTRFYMTMHRLLYIMPVSIETSNL